MSTGSCGQPRRWVPERHAQTRAVERYGIAVTQSEMRGLEARLAAGEGMILRRMPDGSTTRVIRLKGELVTLVYGINGFIYTFLPRDAPFKRTGVRRR